MDAIKETKMQLQIVIIKCAIKAAIAYLIRRDGVDLIEDESRDQVQHDLLGAWETLNSN